MIFSFLSVSLYPFFFLYALLSLSPSLSLSLSLSLSAFLTIHHSGLSTRRLASAAHQQLASAARQQLASSTRQAARLSSDANAARQAACFASADAAPSNLPLPKSARSHYYPIPLICFVVHQHSHTNPTHHIHSNPCAGGFCFWVCVGGCGFV